VIDVTAAAKTITGFTYDHATGDITMAVSGNEATIYYTRNTYNVTYSWTGDIPADQTIPANRSNIPYNTTYAVDAKYVSGYQVTGTKNGIPGTYSFSGWDKTGTLTITDNVEIKGSWLFTQYGQFPVTYSFTGDHPAVTVPNGANYYEHATVTVADGWTTVREGHRTWTFQGWTTTDATIGSNGQFSMPSKAVAIVGTWTYADDPTYTVTVNYVYSYGGTAAPTVNKTDLYTGDTYDVTSPTINGYTVDKAQVNGTIANENVVITVTYTPIPVAPSYYTVTVNYLNQADNSVLAQPHSETHREYTSYDVTAYDKIAIEGYTYAATSGDQLTGTLNGNKVINVYYTVNEPVIIPDEPTPGGDKPVTPTTPTEPTNPGTEIIDDNTPMGNLPNTGAPADVIDPVTTLGLVALILSMLAAGLGITHNGRRKDEDDAQ